VCLPFIIFTCAGAVLDGGVIGRMILRRIETLSSGDFTHVNITTTEKTLITTHVTRRPQLVVGIWIVAVLIAWPIPTLTLTFVKSSEVHVKEDPHFSRCSSTSVEKKFWS
jgi:hypothetical protein